MYFLMCLLCPGILEIDLWQIRISLYVCVSTTGIVCSLDSYIHTVPDLKSVLSMVTSNTSMYSKSVCFELLCTVRSHISNRRKTSSLRIQTFFVKL